MASRDSIVINCENDPSVRFVDEDMERIQTTIKQLQTTFAGLEYDLHLKEGLTPNISDSIDCEIIWRRNRTDDQQRSIAADIDEDTHMDRNNDEAGGRDHSATGGTSSPPSSTAQDLCLLSPTRVRDTSSSNVTNRVQQANPSAIRNMCLPKHSTTSDGNPTTDSSNTSVPNTALKKRRICARCGKY